MFEHLMRNAISGLIWVVRHPGETTLAIIVTLCVCMVLAAVFLARWERHEQAKAEAALERARRFRALNPQAVVTAPRAPGLRSTRVS